MRPRRVFFKNSYHHIMNHFIDDIKPFTNYGLAQCFINLIKQYAQINRIDVYAYCLMPDHFHIVCKNEESGLPEFVKNVCSRFVMNYNKIVGRKGPLFFDRYKSTVIQDDNYLMTSLLYLFLNPYRKRLVKNPFDYNWSSINHLFMHDIDCFDNNEAVEVIFGTYDELIKKLNYWIRRDMNLPLHHFGELEFLGDMFYYQKMIKMIDRRARIKKVYKKRRRDNDKERQILDVFNEFKDTEGINPLEIDYNSWHNKRMRMKLLIKLREECGLKYSEIVLLKPFEDLRYQSLSDLYIHSKKH